MVLKSYRLLKKNKKKKKRKIGGLVTAGIGAILGVALVGETARAISRI